VNEFQNVARFCTEKKTSPRFFVPKETNKKKKKTNNPRMRFCTTDNCQQLSKLGLCQRDERTKRCIETPDGKTVKAWLRENGFTGTVDRNSIRQKLQEKKMWDRVEEGLKMGEGINWRYVLGRVPRVEPREWPAYEERPHFSGGDYKGEDYPIRPIGGRKLWNTIPTTAYVAPELVSLGLSRQADPYVDPELLRAQRVQRGPRRQAPKAPKPYVAPELLTSATSQTPYVDQGLLDMLRR
jgi:hypothetical protein